MRRIFFLLSIMFFSVTMSVYSQNSVKYVKPLKENLRNSPNGDKTGELLSGTNVKVLETKGNWSKVNVTAWIWSGSLTDNPAKVDGFSITAAHILLQNQQDAEKVLKELISGANFAELAKKYSIDEATKYNGGLLGKFKRGDLMPEFESAAFKLKKGQISGIVKTRLGYHIIKRVN